MKRLAILALVLASSPAWARSEKTEPFTPAEVFPTAVRFLRIDAGVKIVEKDADAGYVLFDLTEDKHVFRGALELVKTTVEGRDSVRLVLRIDDRPAYVEQMLLDKLDAKLRAELRPTAPRKKPADKVDDKDKPAEPGSGSGSSNTGSAGSGSSS